MALWQGANPNTRFALDEDRVSATQFFNRASQEKILENPSLLKIAAENGSRRIVEKMLKAGADPSL
jgi:hypothetical protein